MKLLIFSDIHGDLKALERLMEIEADHYIAAGDLCNFGRGLDRTGDVMKPRADRVRVMPGNHESADQAAAFCAKFGFREFHGVSFMADRWHVAGLGYSNITPFNTPGEYTETELARQLEPFASLNPLVLICHCPPQGTVLDRVNDRLHPGSTAVRDFIAKHEPEYFFCGHIHEAAGKEERIGPTLARNVGKRGYLLELS